MSYYQPEPNYKHGDPPRIGIIMANLGTPDAPDAKSLRKYLGQFLMDRRVVEIPRFIWCLILYCIILVIRPATSAKKYQQIWTKEGSPLLVNAKKQMALLKKQLKKDYKEPIEVELGMSYGNPSMPDAFKKLREKNCTKIISGKYSKIKQIYKKKLNLKKNLPKKLNWDTPIKKFII